jgi:hypothetical protein
LSVAHTFAVGGKTYGISATATDEDGAFGPSNTLSVAVDHGFLGVETLTQTATGFHVEFNRAFDPSKINLYGSQGGGAGPADVTLVGTKTGAVTGSLVLDADDKGFTFIRTGSVLAADTYTATLFSRANGFVDTLGRTLDGNDNDVNGDNYTGSFVVAASTAPTLSIPDFVRGPGQAVNVPAPGIGIPITLTNGAGISAISFDLHYNPQLLTIGAITSALPGANVQVNASPDLGLVHVDVTGITGLTASAATLVSIQASVPGTAPYGAKDLLDIQHVVATVHGAATAGVDNDGIHVVGYFGDVTGDAGYTTLDAALIQRVALGSDSGFDVDPMVDPVVVADISGDGTLTSFDTALVFKNALTPGSVPSIPKLPSVLPKIVKSGPDPLVSLSRDFRVASGGVVTVPIMLDHAAGLDAVELRLAYDPTALELLDVRYGDLTTGFQGIIDRQTPAVACSSSISAPSRPARPLSCRSICNGPA